MLTSTRPYLRPVFLVAACLCFAVKLAHGHVSDVDMSSLGALLACLGLALG